MIAADLREQAALICAICSSNAFRDFPPFAAGCASIGVSHVADGGPAALAAHARQHARAETSDIHAGQSLWAEAESLLRTGWTPPAGWDGAW